MMKRPYLLAFATLVLFPCALAQVPDQQREALLNDARRALTEARRLFDKGDYANAETACTAAVDGFDAAGIGGFAAHALMAEILYEQGFDRDAYKHIAQIYKNGRHPRVDLLLTILGSRIGNDRSSRMGILSYTMRNSEKLKTFTIPERDWPGLDTPVQRESTALLFLALEPGRPIERSLRDLTAAAKLLPESPAVHYALGITYQRANNMTEAMKHLQFAETRASGRLLELTKQRLVEVRAVAR